MAVGVDGAGLYVVNGDAAWTEIAGQSLDQPYQARLAHRIHGASGKRNAVGVATAKKGNNQGKDG